MKKAVLILTWLVVIIAFSVGFAYAYVEGPYNTFLGSYAGASITDGYSNTFIGSVAGYKTTTGNNNTFVGRLAGHENINGTENIYIGHQAGYYNTGGSGNVYIGYSAGINNISGYSNVFIGQLAGSAETGSNRLYIDNCSVSSGSPDYLCNKPLIYGEFDNRRVRINGTLIMTAVSTPSDIRLKKNIEPLKSSLAKVKQLHGVSFEWRAAENPGRGFGDGRIPGLVAQDVIKTLPEAVSMDGEGYMSLSYDKLIPVLVEAIKEQDEVIREKNTRIEKQEKALSDLAEIVKRLEAKVNRLEGRNPEAGR